jgi:hypothetical protein
MQNAIVSPAYIEPVVGWRMWHAVEDRGATHLTSVVYRTVWPHGAPLVASCRCLRLPFFPFRRARHDAPGLGCNCGIYAAEPDVVRTYLPDHFTTSRALPVVGRVFLWGAVHECVHGWRASHAYPSRLYVPIGEVRLERVASIVDGLRRYGVPINTVDGTSADAVMDEVRALAAAA